MEQLGFPDRHHALAAEGWLELGSAAEAADELARVSPAGQQHPDTLELHWRILACRGEWTEALGVASAVVTAAPQRVFGWIHRSYTLHELKRTPEAWESLLPAVRKFPKDPVIAYNLACYACQMGDLTGAQSWLRRAVRLRSAAEIRAMAADDPDLSPLAEFLRSL